MCCLVAISFTSLAVWGQTTLTTGAIKLEEVGEDIVILHIDGLNAYSQEAGRPQLPVWRKVMAVSDDWEAQSVQVATDKMIETSLNGARLYAVPGPQRKEGESDTAPIDTSLYNHNQYYSLPLVSVDELGRMGRQRMVRINVAPVSYNPVSGALRIYSELQITLGDTPKAYHNELSDNAIQHFVIVAPIHFREALQPFIRWKRQSGYMVSEQYFDNIGDRDTIRAQLKKLYDHATPSQPAPTYVLLAADDAIIPSFIAHRNISGFDLHTTDLYYGEYSDDMLPDAQVGRWPASDTAQLNAIIEKTLEYEQYQMADNQHLRRALLVAGKEERDPAPSVTNGQVNYLKERIVTHDSTIDTLCYYNPASDTLADEIYAQLDSGVALVSYTAHCQSWGWMHPDVNRNAIDTLTPNGRYCLSINNCCRSNAISNDSFGKHLLRKTHGGAIGVVGATNETLWEEDYYWNVGVQAALSPHPQYNEAHPGAIDRWIGSTSERVITQGQIAIAGNWAVVESGSAYADFYWEIYTLMGDPSLMPYLGIPTPTTLNADSYERGDCSMTISGTPYALVGASWNDTLIAVCRLDSNGNGQLINPLALPDTLLLTISAPQHQPMQQIVAAQTIDGTRLVATHFQLYDAENHPISRMTQGETATALISLRNSGNDTLRNGVCSLSAPITIDGATQYSLSQLAPSEETTVSYTLTADCTQQADQIGIGINCCNNDTSCTIQTVNIDILHKKIRLGKPLLLVDGSNAVGLDACKDYTWQITLYNEGNGDITPLRYGLENQDEEQANRLDAGDSLTITYTLQTGDSIRLLTMTIQADDGCEQTTQSLCYVAGLNIEHFEKGDLLHYPWQGDWIIDSTTTHNGKYAAHSGELTDGSPSELTISMTVNRRDSVRYWARTACQTAEQLQFIIDGAICTTLEGDNGWTRQSHVVDAGHHTLQWRYTGDNSTNQNGHAWIDDIQLPFGCYWRDHAGYDSIATRPNSIVPNEVISNISLYPNPADEQLWIISERDATIEIYDMMGRMVGDFSAKGGTATQYFTKDLRCGVYCVWIQTAEGATLRRLTIRR